MSFYVMIISTLTQGLIALDPPRLSCEYPFVIVSASQLIKAKS